MSPKRKGGAAAKPPAQPKTVATTSKSTVTSSTPAKRVQATPSSSGAPTTAQRVSPPPPVAPSRSGVTIQTNPIAPPPRTLAQPPKPSAQPARSALASHTRGVPAAAPAPAFTVKPGPSQKHTFTRSDRVRAEWRNFEETWVVVRQKQIEKELDALFKEAEQTSRAKGKARSGGTPDGMDKIVSTMQREFALAARDEWEARLQRAGVQAEDWTDMTTEEMIAVEQVLACDEPDNEPGVYAQVHHVPAASSTGFGNTVIQEKTPPTPPQSLGGWKAHSTTSSLSLTPQPAKPSQPLHNTQPIASQNVPVATLHGRASAQTWGGKATSHVEDSRQSKAAHISSAPRAVSTQPMPSMTTANPMLGTTPLPSSADLLVYAVPLSLSALPLDPALAANAEYAGIADKLHINSIRQFHLKAADADAELARQLSKPMPTADRDFAIRAHQMAMEQSARDIVTRRNQLLDEERRKRGLGGPGGDSAPPSTVPHAPVSQPPGAFPEERIQPARQPEPESEPLLEYAPEQPPQTEAEPEVDEVIEIPIKGKGKGKKGKKAAVEAKPAANGRSTPTPAATTSAARAGTPVQKASPAAEAKGKATAPTIATWNTTRTAAPARAASPAPINTKRAAAVTTNGRGPPAPTPSSSTPTPWEILQAKSSSSSGTAMAETNAADAPPNGIWAPPMTRATSSNKNPFAPSRPSRLAQVTQVADHEPAPPSPESPEPPSPQHEPTGHDYVKWFAGSSSEDEDGASSTLDEDEEDEEDEDVGGATSSAMGGLLASLAGASPWAFFGDGNKQSRGRAASPVRGRGATPTPARVTASRFAPAVDNQPAYTRWGVPSAGSSAFGAGPSAASHGPPGMWKEAGDDLEQMVEIASSALNSAVVGNGRQGTTNIQEAMAMFVTASQARETLATPVGGRSAWRR
ncbi:hypothetical protein C8Q79DRAFT_926156 [Trametes meyenii]|nr:hypothetical protein C8Q79DRAFT_926156 [Trametes meyenii]